MISNRIRPNSGLKGWRRRATQLGTLTHGLMRARAHPMHGAFMLGKPIVAVSIGTTHLATLPSGASVEVQENVDTALVQVIWQKRSFVVHLPDLLDACRVEDVGEMCWPDGWGS